ncbi:MAG: TonB-dependent receptor [Leptothrix sp. (in: b-proteobacteria)]
MPTAVEVTASAPAPTSAEVVAPPAPGESALPRITVRSRTELPAKETLQATRSGIGKGDQALRDIPQSVTVVTERLIDERRLDTMKEALKNTAGITFLAAEGGEEDIRLRGFPLQSTGDVFVDGLRDPAFYERDTFFLDRMEVLRGSASMLFGRGSTGGAVNQVSKAPHLLDEHQVDLTLASHNYRRLVGDFNFQTGEHAALRLGLMHTKADNNGAGSSLDKNGVAGTYRWGVGEPDEFSASLYHLDNNNGMNYGMPWIRPSATSPVADTTLLPLDPSTYYGMASDRNAGQATHATLSHTHRFDTRNELTTRIRQGRYERDQRASAIRFCTQRTDATTGVVTNPQCPTAVSLENFGAATILTRGTNLKIQDLDTLYAQSDFSSRFEALDLQHELLAGIDYALEKKTVRAVRSAAQGGVDLVKPTTTVGAPDDGAWIDEDARVLRESSRYTSRGMGVYAQDLVQVAPQWKLLAGLRYDHLVGDYDTLTIPTAAAGPVTTTGYQMKVAELSKRAGVLFQPDERTSFHFSAATSFNTSGDAYSLGASNVNTPPEQSINLELGAKLDSANGRFTTRLAVFRSTKLHERNTDPLVDLVTLSGKRHAAGAEIDFAGRLTSNWEVFASYMWMPVAKIDEGVAGSEGEGTRPSLTPRNSGTFWNTYQLTPALRLGGGINFRSSQTPNRNPGWAAPGFVTGDLMAEYTFDPDRLIFKLNVSNVTNKLYADSLYTGHYIPGPGRLVALTGSLKF